MLRIIVMLVMVFQVPVTHVVHAQDRPPALIITLRDTAGQGIPDATIRVLDGSGTREFARTITNAAGIAEIVDLPTGQVRVWIGGVHAGKTLVLTGKDASGIRMLGSDPPLRLDLRIEPDGRVLPDPETMITPDLGGPMVAIPTAPLAQAVAIEAPSVRVPTALQPTAFVVDTVQEQAEALAVAQDRQMLWWIVGVCALLGSGIVVVALRWGRPV
jgi:hypothetical protein